MFPLSSHYVNQTNVSHGPVELIGHYKVKAVSRDCWHPVVLISRFLCRCIQSSLFCHTSEPL